MNSKQLQEFIDVFNSLKKITTFLDLPKPTQTFLMSVYFKNSTLDHQNEIIGEATALIKESLAYRIGESLHDSFSTILTTRLGAELMEGIALYLRPTMIELFEEALREYHTN